MTRGADKQKASSNYKSLFRITIIALALVGILFVTRFSNTTNAHSLGFSIYTNTGSLLPLYKTYYANATSSDLLIDDAWSPSSLPYVSYWNTPQAFPRMIIANNYSELNSYILGLAQQHNFSKNDYVDYDSEDWALTPTSEQQQMVQYTQKACVAVHNAGYKFAISPEIDVPGWYGLTQFSSINWTCVDFIDLQEQSHSGSPSALTKNVTYLTSVAKGANPNLVVFVQLDMAAGSQSTLESDILALSQINGVNGVMIQDLCTSTSCNNELTALIDYTESLKNGATTSTSSVTSTTITHTSSTPSTATTKPTTISSSTSIGSTSASTSTSSSTSATTSTASSTPTTSSKSTSVNSTTIIQTRYHHTSNSTGNSTNSTIPSNTVSNTTITTTDSTTSIPATTTIGGTVTAGGGSSSTGGGAMTPLVTYKNNCAIITNVSVPNSFSYSVGNETFTNVVDNYIGSNYTSIILNGDTYILNLDTKVPIGSSTYIELTNVSYIPILHSVSLLSCPSAPHPSYSLVDLSFSVNPLELSNVSPSNATKFVSITNAQNTPPAPSGLTALSEVSIDVVNASINTFKITANMLCGIANVQPYALNNSTWVAITNYKVNKGHCTVSLQTANKTIAFMVPMMSPAKQVMIATNSLYNNNYVPVNGNYIHKRLWRHGYDTLAGMTGLAFAIILGLAILRSRIMYAPKIKR